MVISWGHLVSLGVLSNILFLSVTSQWLFNSIDDFALDNTQTYVFSFLCFNILICYARCCLTDPGFVPRQRLSEQTSSAKERWCRKCQNIKPPRAHHCSHCKRCIPKMDHHCVWIVNCVSYRIFPHFFRVLLYNVLGMSYLQYFLFVRIDILWSNRHLPSYLGPSASQLVHLLLLLVSNSITFFAIFLMFCKSLYTMMFNITTIEGWEIERHAVLVKRARANGGYLYGPNGIVVYLQKQEFPFDIGIWDNITQSMGTSNVLAWFWSFGASLPTDGGLSFKENGFEDTSKGWPPPDPEKIPITLENSRNNHAVERLTPDYSTQSDIDAFRHRQAVDAARRDPNGNVLHARHGFAQRRDTNNASDEASGLNIDFPAKQISRSQNMWKNSEGERLADFGVDEEAELNDDDIPLSRLIQNKKTPHPSS